MAALEGNARTLVLRTSWVYSPWGRNFVLTMLKLGGKRPQLRIVDDQFGKPTSALDCTKFETTFGVKTVPWPEALARVLAMIVERERK